MSLSRVFCEGVKTANCLILSPPVMFSLAQLILIFFFVYNIVLPVPVLFNLAKVLKN